MKKECKDWEKMFASLQKERTAEMNDTTRALKEKQDLYAGFDSYLLRSGGSRGLTSSASTLSMEYDKVEIIRTRNGLIDFIQSSSSTCSRPVSDYVELFEQMKKAAGVTEVKEVIERFRTQGETATALESQNDQAKEEVMRLTKIKEELQAQWEKVR